MRGTLSLEMLPVFEGDCLWLEYGVEGETHRVVIDGGPPDSDALRQRINDELESAPGGKLHIELLVVTHVDNDHIGGVLELLENPPDGLSIGDVWFNAYRHLLPKDRLGFDEGDRLADLLEKHWRWNHAFSPSKANGEGAVVVPNKGELPATTLKGGLRLTLLSPTEKRLAELANKWPEVIRSHDLKESDAEAEEEEDRLGRKDRWPPDVVALADKKPPSDPSKPNRSSIAFLVEYGNRSLVLTGDAHPRDLNEAIARVPLPDDATRLRLDALKLPHHGSRGNLNNELLKAVTCSHYLVSTSGRGSSKHPDHEALARVIVHGGTDPKLVFNYDNEATADWRKGLRRAPSYTPLYPSKERCSLSWDVSLPAGAPSRAE